MVHLSELYLIQNRIRKCKPKQTVPITKYCGIRKTIMVCAREPIIRVLTHPGFTVLTCPARGCTTRCRVSYRVTSKTFGIGSYECYWGDILKTKSGKIYTISSDINEKHSILYTTVCIESAVPKGTNSGS